MNISATSNPDLKQATLPSGIVTDLRNLNTDREEPLALATIKPEDKEDLRETINLNRNRLVSLSQETNINYLSNEKEFNKIKTRSARYLSTRPAMYTAIVTALGDDFAATMAGLLRNVSDGVLNFANASEEAFKGLLKFVLNVSSVSLTENILDISAKLILPKHLQHEGQNIMRLSYESLSNTELLKEELKSKISETAPREHLNTFKAMEGFSPEKRYIELLRAEKSVKFADSFNPSSEDMKKIKDFQLAVRFLESGIKGSLWASIPFLNRLFRTHILGADGFTGVQDGNGEKYRMPLLQKLAVGLSLSSGFLLQGAVITLTKMSEGNNQFSNWLIKNTEFNHGLFPSKTAIYFNQGLAYDFSRLANAEGKAELFESSLITSLFTPILYFGDNLTRFIGSIADNQLANKYHLEPGILVKREIKPTNKFKQLFPEELKYSEIMPKVEHNPELKHDAKLAHADMTITKILLHSLTVLGARLFINNQTKNFSNKTNPSEQIIK